MITIKVDPTLHGETAVFRKSTQHLKIPFVVALVWSDINFNTSSLSTLAINLLICVLRHSGRSMALLSEQVQQSAASAFMFEDMMTVSAAGHGTGH